MDKILAGLALALLPLTVTAQMYRWTDDRGVVNYSNSPPPPGVTAVKLAEPEPQVVPSPAPEAPRATDPQLRQRVETLERELAVERNERQLTAQADDDRRRRAREECERQRRVDCDQLESQPEGAPIVVVPRVRPHPNIVPTLPVPQNKPPAAPSAPPLRRDSAGARISPGTKGL